MEEPTMSENKHQFNLAADYVGYAAIKVVGVGGAGGKPLDRRCDVYAGHPRAPLHRKRSLPSRAPNRQRPESC